MAEEKNMDDLANALINKTAKVVIPEEVKSPYKLTNLAPEEEQDDKGEDKGEDKGKQGVDNQEETKTGTTAESEKRERKSFRAEYSKSDDAKGEEKEKAYTKAISDIEDLRSVVTTDIEKVLRQAAKEGKNPILMLRNIDISDVKEMTDEQVVRKMAAKHFTDANDIDAAWEGFEEMKPLDKAEKLAEYRAKLEDSNQTQLKPFDYVKKELTDAQKADMAKQKEAVAELDLVLGDFLEAKEVNGVKYSMARIRQIEEVALHKIHPDLFRNPDGSYDANKLFALANFALFGEVVEAEKNKKAEDKGKREILKDKFNVNKDSQNKTRMPTNNDRQGKMDNLAQALISKNKRK